MGHRGCGLLPDVGLLGFHRRAVPVLPWYLALLTRRGNSGFVVRKGTRCGPSLPRGRWPCRSARLSLSVSHVGDSLPGLDHRAGRVPLGPGPSRCLCSCLSGVFWPRRDLLRAFPAPDQPFRGPCCLARGMGCGVLHLIAAVLVPLPPLGGVPQLGAQAVRTALQPPADYIRPLLPDGGFALGLLLDPVHIRRPSWRCPFLRALWSSAGTAGCGGENRPGKARWRCRT